MMKIQITIKVSTRRRRLKKRETMTTSILPSFNKKYPPLNLNLLHDTCVIHISLSFTILLIKCHSYVIVMYDVLWNYFYSLVLTWFLQNSVSLGSWILGFKHYRQQSMENCIFLIFNLRGLSEQQNPRKLEPHE